MSTNFDNIYDLSTEQLEMLDDAEEKMLRNDLGAAEKLLLSMLKSDEECIPVLSNLGTYTAVTCLNLKRPLNTTIVC